MFKQCKRKLDFMRIYIDEAGVFVPRADGQPSYSVVLALIIPSSIEAELFYEFLRLRDTWPGNEIEIKGSKLSEDQAAQVINLLGGYDVLVTFMALDMATHRDDAMSRFKNEQAASLTIHLTPEHSETVTREMREIADAVRRMPNQLFVQGFATTQLIFDATQQATLYYAQRAPIELGDISWIIDRKNRTITEMEQTWATLILPASESHYAKTPLDRLRGADYSYYDARYGIDRQNASEELLRHIDWMRSQYDVKEPLHKVIDSRKLLSEQRQFGDSRDSLGLQLADMLATILRRALNGNLGKEGWKDFGRLLILKTRSSFIQLGSSTDGQPRFVRGRAEAVSKVLSSRAKSMLLDSSVAAQT